MPRRPRSGVPRLAADHHQGQARRLQLKPTNLPALLAQPRGGMNMPMSITDLPPDIPDEEIGPRLDKLRSALQAQGRAFAERSKLGSALREAEAADAEAHGDA